MYLSTSELSDPAYLYRLSPVHPAWVRVRLSGSEPGRYGQGMVRVRGQQRNDMLHLHCFRLFMFPQPQLTGGA